MWTNAYNTMMGHLLFESPLGSTLKKSMVYLFLQQIPTNVSMNTFVGDINLEIIYKLKQNFPWSLHVQNIKIMVFLSSSQDAREHQEASSLSSQFLSVPHLFPLIVSGDFWKNPFHPTSPAPPQVLTNQFLQATSKWLAPMASNTFLPPKVSQIL